MSDDSFIREVDEELRSDRMQAIWSRFGNFIIAIAVLIVLLTAGYRGWQYYSEQQSAKSGDAFIAAIELSNEGKHAEAITALEELSKSGTGQYPALAKIRIAGELAQQGDVDQAVEAFDAIAADSSFDETLRNVAKLRAGLLLVDASGYDEVLARLESMAEAGASFRHSAREGLGLSAWKENRSQDAYKWFKSITDDIGAPNGVRSRARMMLELLAGKGVDSAS